MKKRKPQDAVVANVKRLRAEVRSLERRLESLNRTVGHLQVTVIRHLDKGARA